MLEKIKKFRKDKELVRHIVVSALLLALWLFLTIIFVVNFDTSFSIWSYSHQNSDIQNLNYQLFYKGETFRGELVAKDNNLGIISVRFQTYIRPPYSLEDIFLFKLKEKGTKTWYYQNTYRSGLVYDVPFFPFGFPQIANSKGKTYDFEITSLNGNAVNGVSISTRYPILQSKYKYSGHELLQNKKELISFLIIKFSNAFQTPDVIFTSFIYLLPLLFYLIWISVLGRMMHPITNKIREIVGRLENTFLWPFIKLFKKIFIYNLDYFLVLVILVDVLIIQSTNNFVYLVVSALWVATLRVYKEDSKKTFIVGLIFIALCPLFLALKSEPTAEQFGAWAFMFLVAGTIQILLELKAAKENS